MTLGQSSVGWTLASSMSRRAWKVWGGETDEGVFLACFRVAMAASAVLVPVVDEDEDADAEQGMNWGVGWWRWQRE